MPLNVIREDIQNLTAYAVADVSDDFIKLDAMEVPYLLPEHLRQEWANQLVNIAINRYPHPQRSGLPDVLRQAFAIPKEAQIALGNGSDELIQLLTQLVAKPNAVMLAVEPSFVMYQHYAHLYGLQYISVPLKADFCLDLEAMIHAIEQYQPAIIFIAYPNNPTGVPFEREQIERIIELATGLVVIDEAYGAFSEDSFLPQAGQSERLLVLRTLSKIGFAGLRLGYVAGSPLVIEQLAKIVPPYNMNQLSLFTAQFALQHMDAVNHNIEQVKQERERMQQELAKLPETEVFPSQANFITVRLTQAQKAFEQLYQHRILVKKLDQSHLLLCDCLRITIGTPDENNQVLSVLNQHVNNINKPLAAIAQSRKYLIGIMFVLLMALFAWLLWQYYVD